MARPPATSQKRPAPVCPLSCETKPDACFAACHCCERCQQSLGSSSYSLRAEVFGKEKKRDFSVLLA